MKRRLLLPGFLAASALCAQGVGAAAPNESGTYLAHLLQGGTVSGGMVLAGMVAAFALGALHALSPGHGKAIVAAYLVGSRSTAKHAAFLGLAVTFTHTVSVFLLGFVTLFLSRYILPDKLYPMLGTISGLSIVWVGATLLSARWRGLRKARPHVHHYDSITEGEVTFGSLMALGASGGMVPCPSALVLLLSSVALGRIALGLTLLVAFSSGLAVVLIVIGMAALYARNLLPQKQRTAQNVALRYLPIASAAVITCVGALMTAAALGVVRVAI